MSETPTADDLPKHLYERMDTERLIWEFDILLLRMEKARSLLKRRRITTKSDDAHCDTCCCDAVEAMK